MAKFLEIHALQSFPPSLLNRDDTGSPKDCDFGGYRRARISSQCIKRSMRSFVRENELLPSGSLATRTKRLYAELARRLQHKGVPEETLNAVVGAGLAACNLKAADSEKMEYLVFLGDGEMAELAGLMDEHWDALIKLSDASTGTEEDKSAKARKKSKKEAHEAVPPEVKNAFQRVLDGKKAVDLALFGRMLADLPEKNVDAACQVAHAISTHTVSREFDFFTAVDDLKPVDTQGADMMGTVEFNSACYYRYMAINLDILEQNLQNDRAMIQAGLKAFVTAAALAYPSGKQNTFAAFTPPSFFAVSVASGGNPRSLANAFEKPVRQVSGKSLSGLSTEALDTYWEQLDRMYGVPEGRSVFVACVDSDMLSALKQYAVAGVNDVVDGAVAAAMKLL